VSRLSELHRSARFNFVWQQHAIIPRELFEANGEEQCEGDDDKSFAGNGNTLISPTHLLEFYTHTSQWRSNTIHVDGVYPELV
jgi:hypothetical protein